MEKFKDKLARFMYGRYGADQLYYFLIVVCVVFVIANNIVKSAVISILSMAFLIWTIFRVFSKNVYKRRAENEKFMKIWNSIKSKFSLTIRRVKGIKTYRFRKCPNCKKVLRLPRKRGKHAVECPCCHNEFQVKVLL
jgi:hypothetical protein